MMNKIDRQTNERILCSNLAAKNLLTTYEALIDTPEIPNDLAEELIKLFDLVYDLQQKLNSFREGI